MASSSRRWINVTDMCVNFGTKVTIQDAIAGNISLDAQTLGSNSETDIYANHYLQAIQASATLTIRTYDVYAVSQLQDKLGVLGSVWFKLPLGVGSATDAVKGRSIKISASTTHNDGGCFITGLTIPGEHDTESQCEVTFALRSDGAHAPWLIQYV